jgi:hypothetical protein
VHVERFDSAPARGVCAVAAETFGNESAGVRDVGEARVHSEGAGVVNEIVNGLCVGVCAARGGDGSVMIRRG